MNKEEFLFLLCSLEGFKTKFREFHWNAELLSEHKLCDQIMDDLTEFQDNFAEESFTIFGKFGLNEFIAEQLISSSTAETLNMLLSLIIDTKNTLSNSDDFLCSLSAMCDEYIHKIRKSIYLLGLK